MSYRKRWLTSWEGMTFQPLNPYNPCDERYIHRHEWLILYGTCRKLNIPVPWMLWVTVWSIKKFRVGKIHVPLKHHKKKQVDYAPSWATAKPLPKVILIKLTPQPLPKKNGTIFLANRPDICRFSNYLWSKFGTWDPSKRSIKWCKHVAPHFLHSKVTSGAWPHPQDISLLTAGSPKNSSI